MKVRCSQLGALLTEPRLKKDKEAGNLSETAKTMVKEKWLKDKFGYEQVVVSKEMKKGIMFEQDSMQLVSEYYKQPRIRFAEKLENTYITGTPDIVVDGVCVEDIKTSWDIRTFMNAELSKAYEMQLRGYMMLTGAEHARLIYCLLPTDMIQVEEEKKSFWFKFDCDDNHPEYIKIAEQIERNHEIPFHLPIEQRVKVFELERDPDIEERIKIKVKKANEYYNNLRL